MIDTIITEALLAGKSLIEVNKELVGIVGLEALRSAYEELKFVQNVIERYENYQHKAFPFSKFLVGFEDIEAIPRIDLSDERQYRLAKLISCYVSGEPYTTKILSNIKPFYVDKNYFIEQIGLFMYCTDNILNIPLDKDLEKALKLRELLRQYRKHPTSTEEAHLLGLVSAKLEKDKLQISIDKSVPDKTYKL